MRDASPEPAADATSRMRPVNLMLGIEDLARLDRWRAAQPDVPNRSEAIRRMIAAAAEKVSER